MLFPFFNPPVTPYYSLGSQPKRPFKILPPNSFSGQSPLVDQASTVLNFFLFNYATLFDVLIFY